MALKIQHKYILEGICNNINVHIDLYNLQCLPEEITYMNIQ